MQKLDSGHEIIFPDKEVQERQKNDFEGFTYGVVKLMPGGWFYTQPFLEYANKYYNFEYRPSDVVLMTFPKCGTSWLSEIIWNMRNNPNLENSEVYVDPNFRAIFLEFDFIAKCGTIEDALREFLPTFHKLYPGKDPKDGVFLQMCQNAKDPRTIKTHLPFSLLNPKLLDTNKVVYLARNPKDVIVSYHHHSRLLKHFQFVNSLEQFIQYFMDDELMYSPYWGMIKEAWMRRAHPNLHFVFFEDLKRNPKEEIQKLNSFLETNLTEKQIENIVQHTNFETMKNKKEIADKGVSDEERGLYINLQVFKEEGGMYRKGQVGSYKEKLSMEQITRIDEWTKINVKEMEDFQSPW